MRPNAPSSLHWAKAPRDTVIRGQALRSLVSAIGALFAPSDVQRVLSLVPKEASATVRDVSSTGWYPISWYAAVHRAARVVSGAGPELARELGREARNIDARGLYRFVLRFQSPESFLRHIDRVLALYVDGPALIVAPVVTNAVPSADGTGMVTESYAAFRFLNSVGFDENIWQEAIGSLEALLFLSGALTPAIESWEGGGSESWLAGEMRWSGRDPGRRHLGS